MWKRSFLATAVTLGDTVDDAVAAIDGGKDQAAAAELVTQLQSPQRGARASALAKAVHEIVVQIDVSTLR